MTPKFKIGDWVKTRRGNIRQILGIQKNTSKYFSKCYFVYKLSEDFYTYYEFGLTLLTNEEKLELL